MTLQTFNHQPEQERVITLKEITDLIEVDHSKSMRKVEKLAQEPSFGHLAKTATCINIGNGATREIETYNFTKKQAIAVGARLNNALLMKVIDRLEELENKKQVKLPSKIELAQMVIEAEELNQKLLAHNEEMKPKALFADSVAQSKTSILIGQFAKAISTDDFEIGQNRLFKWLRDNKYLIDGGTQHNQPMQKYITNNYFETTERTINNPDGSTRITITTKITGKGQVALTKKILESLHVKKSA